MKFIQIGAALPFIKTMQNNEYNLFIKYGLKYFKNGMKVLEIGPTPEKTEKQRKLSLRLLIADRVKVNYEVGGLNKGYKVSFDVNSGKNNGRDNSYDIVLAACVIEHVRPVWDWVKDIARILKPGGVVIFICPISWMFHQSPYDCWRIYPDGFKALFDWAGLTHEFSTFEEVTPDIDSIAIGKK